MIQHSKITLPDGLEVFYQTSGNGDIPVLFVPGWTMTTEVYCHQLDFFTHSNQFRCITCDPRSHGKSTVTNSGNTYEQHGRDLHHFITALGLEQIVLCGWSFGTLATLSYVNQFGADHLSGFIMLDGPPKATGRDSAKEWITYTYDDVDGSQEFFTMGKLRNPKQTNIDFAQWMLEHENQPAIDWIISMTRQTPNEIAALLNSTATFLNYESELIKIGSSMPVWCVVRAEQHAVVTQWCQQHLPTAQLLAYGGHIMFWEQPDRFNTALLDFLTTCTKE